MAAELKDATAARDTLLDILNAVLASQGGKIVIPSVEVEASTRRPVDVTIAPGRNGAPDRHVIELRGYQDDNPRGIAARLGLRLPGMG